MTRSGYRNLLVVLSLASLSGVFFSLWLGWQRTTPIEMSCTQWERAPAEGRFRLSECSIAPKPLSQRDDRCTVMVGTDQWLWTTRDPELVRAAGRDAIAERAYQRFLVLDEPRTIEVRIDTAYDGAFEMHDLGTAKIGIWVGLVPMLVFGIPLFFLVRSQRRWRRARVAWERTKGVLTEGDKPTAF